MTAVLKSKDSPTLNRMGYVHRSSNPASDAFYEYVSLKKGSYVDVGPAYGYSTCEALSRGVDHILAIDLEENHLRTLTEACPVHLRSKLKTQIAFFPDEVALSPSTYDGIHVSRVLLFLSPDQTQRSFRDMFVSLKPGGKIFVLTSTPYSPTFPLRDQIVSRESQGEKWPSYFENLWELIPEHQDRFPNHIFLMDHQMLVDFAEDAGFNVIDNGYWNLTDGVTSYPTSHVFLVAEKPLSS